MRSTKCLVISGDNLLAGDFNEFVCFALPMISALDTNGEPNRMQPKCFNSKYNSNVFADLPSVLIDETA